MRIETMSALIVRITGFIILVGLCSVGCQPGPRWEAYEGGIHLVLRVESQGDPAVDCENTISIADIAGKRVEQFGITQSIIRIQGDRHIVVQLPPCKNPDRVAALISKPCMLEFKLVDEEHSVQKALQGNIPSGTEVLYQQKRNPETGRESRTPYLVAIDAPLTGEYITNAHARLDAWNEKQAYVSVTFDSTGAELLERITGENIGRRLAIVVDNEVYSAPVIRQRVSGGEAVIEGAFTIEEARDIAIVFRAGGYPAHTEVIEYRSLNRVIWLGNK
jgi:preprotein translocase subunit SecD